MVTKPMQGTTEIEIKGAVPDVLAYQFSDGGWEKITTNIPDEMELTVYINSQELVRILCTPAKLNCLVLGFLYTQGIISGVNDVTSMRVCEDDSLADVKLNNPQFELPKLRTLTSGCGSGATFVSQGQKVDSNLVVSPGEVLSLMKHFQEKMELYRFCRGVHASAFASKKEVLVVAEDIGRHNTLDKIQGECLLRKLSTKDGLLFTTGRMSSEMLLKAAKMQIPVILSRSSPTGRAVTLAQELGITLVGYVRGNRMTVYTHPERLGY
jgi:FdhD protein